MEIEWIPIIGMLSTTVMVVLIVYFVARSRQRRAEVQAEVQAKLIDRFSSAPELIEFLQSPSGRQFVTGVQSAPAVMARDRVASGLTRAIVLSPLGLAFLMLTFFVEDGFAIPAAILLALGIGNLIATVVSYKMTVKLQHDMSSADVTARS